MEWRNTSSNLPSHLLNFIGTTLCKRQTEPYASVCLLSNVYNNSLAIVSCWAVANNKPNESFSSILNTLKEIDLPDGALVMIVKRGKEFLVPNGSLHLQVGDKLLLISESEKGE